MATQNRKAPQDRRPKRTADDQAVAAPAAPERPHLVVKVDGDTFTSTKPVTEYVTFGLTRHYGDNDVMFTVRLIEACFEDQPEALTRMDELTGDDMRTVMRDVMRALEDEQGATLGESSRSSN